MSNITTSPSTSSTDGTSTDEYKNDPATVNSPFVGEKARTPLRVCCYGSSSAKTPVLFLKEAWNLGYILAKRGHTCVNGAGSFGCMAAMNDGADAGDGHIVGVIHEMFLVDGNDFIDRDGGAHSVFKGTGREPLIGREILVAGGDDLQERKKLLVQGAEALVVLPGGPGTWDEVCGCTSSGHDDYHGLLSKLFDSFFFYVVQLWEMACARNLGLTALPIVCVSVNGFYDSFREMLERAYGEGLVKNKPDDVIHFVPSAEEAVRWIELQKEATKGKVIPKVKTRASLLKRSSFFSPPVVSRSISWLSGSGDDEASLADFLREKQGTFLVGTIAFLAGAAIGLLSSRHKRY
jgi:predicted Rossmann-fold nucleotide-binding protein